MSELGDLYGILECKPDASLADLKAHYKRLVLLHHPDKQQSQQQQRSNNGGNDNGGDDGSSDSSGVVDNEADVGDVFRLVRHAWDVLGDAEKKRSYDDALRAEAVLASRAEKVPYSELTLQSDENLTKPCRCGEQYEINLTEFEESGCDLIQCNGCSLYIKIVEC